MNCTLSAYQIVRSNFSKKLDRCVTNSEVSEDDAKIKKLQIMGKVGQSRYCYFMVISF